MIISSQVNSPPLPENRNVVRFRGKPEKRPGNRTERVGITIDRPFPSGEAGFNVIGLSFRTPPPLCRPRGRAENVPFLVNKPSATIRWIWGTKHILFAEDEACTRFTVSLLLRLALPATKDESMSMLARETNDFCPGRRIQIGVGIGIGIEWVCEWLSVLGNRGYSVREEAGEYRTDADDYDYDTDTDTDSDSDSDPEEDKRVPAG